MGMTGAYGSRKRVLVTGGAGFLGSHLIDRLIARGDETLCVDNLSTGDRDNIAHLQGHPRFEFLRHDICLPLHVEVDEIYNLACPASPVHYQKDPVQTTRTCVSGAINMLGLARRLGCRIFQASTSEVYGDPAVHPQPETYRGNVNPVGPRSCYDEGKRCAETLFFDYRRQHGLGIKVARFFNTYGPRMHLYDGRVVSNLVVQALTGRPITLYGEGRQTRAFCYVDDLIDGVLLFMESPDALTGPINLGNPEEISIADLAALVIEMTGSTSRFEYQPLPEDDPARRLPDIGMAKAALGWAPGIALREGLGRTIDYFRGVVGDAGVAGSGRVARSGGARVGPDATRLH
jgi:UDP-glucuronate decarboxylase